MNNNPLFLSVIVPNYNHAPFLTKRIDSILNQTFQDFELIILDDCSTDTSKVIIEQYRNHPKVSTIIYNEINSGSTFKQWQKGIAQAKADYIWIAESDDVSHVEFATELIAALKSDENVVLAYSRSININREGDIVGLNKWADGLDVTRWQTDYKNNGISEISDYLIYRNFIPNASAVIFKKNCFLQINPAIYMSMKYAGDWLIWGNIIAQGNIVFVAKPYNYFRSHGVTTRSVKSLEGEFNRVKEYFFVIDLFMRVFKIKDFKLLKHKWIVEEWVHDKRYLFKHNFIKYLFPPLKPQYFFMLYTELFKVITSKIKK